jgi:hypothetical protein
MILKKSENEEIIFQNFTALSPDLKVLAQPSSSEPLSVNSFKRKLKQEYLLLLL